MLNDPKATEVRGVAKLAKKDARSETGLFLLEGVQGLREIEPSLVKALYATEDCVDKYPELFAGLTYRLVSPRVLEAMCDTKTPQGVVAVCQQLHTDLAQIMQGKPKLVAILSQIRDPGNAGTVLRAADAAGADAVIFSKQSVDVYNPKVVRSTAGSLFHIPFAIEADIDEVFNSLRNAGIQIFAADGGGDFITEVISLAEPTAWVFGNEAWGFEPEVIAKVDRVVGLPIYGRAESLNLATAASVCLYQSAFAQRAK